MIFLKSGFLLDGDQLVSRERKDNNFKINSEGVRD